MSLEGCMMLSYQTIAIQSASHRPEVLAILEPC